MLLVFGFHAFDLVDTLQLLSYFFLEIPAFVVVYSGLLDYLRTALDHQHIVA